MEDGGVVMRITQDEQRQTENPSDLITVYKQTIYLSYGDEPVGGTTEADGRSYFCSELALIHDSLWVSSAHQRAMLGYDPSVRTLCPP